MTDAKGHKVIVCDNGTGVSHTSVEIEYVKYYF